MLDNLFVIVSLLFPIVELSVNSIIVNTKRSATSYFSGGFLAVLLHFISTPLFVYFAYAHPENFYHGVMICLPLLLLVLSIDSKAAELKFSDALSNIKISAMRKYFSANKERKRAVLGLAWCTMVMHVIILGMPEFVCKMINGKVTTIIFCIASMIFGAVSGVMYSRITIRQRVSLEYAPISLFVIAIGSLGLYIGLNHIVYHSYMIGVHSLLLSLYGVFSIIMLAAIGFGVGLCILPLYGILYSGNKSELSIFGVSFYSYFAMSLSCVLSLPFFYTEQADLVLLIVVLCNFFTAVYSCRLIPDTTVKSIVKLYLKFFYKVEITGIESYNPKKNHLIVSNHISHIDMLLIAAFLPSRYVFALDDYPSSFWLPMLLKLLGCECYSVRNQPTHPKLLIQYLTEGKSVVIFPEGRMTATGSLMKIYETPGLIADKSGVQITPIRIDAAIKAGNYQESLRSNKLKYFRAIKLNIFPPVELKVANGIVGRKRRQAISTKLYSIMSNMMFKDLDAETTIFGSILDAMALHGKSHIVVEDAEGEKFSYKRLMLGAILIGRSIVKKIKFGDIVGLMLPSAGGSLATFLGCIMHGRVPAMLNFTSGANVIISCCNVSKIKTIYTSKRLVERAELHDTVASLEEAGLEIIYLEDVKQNLTALQKIISLILFKFIYTYYHLYTEKRYMRKSTCISSIPVAVLFTSGSEGMPKGVVLSNKNIYTNVRQITSVIDLNASDTLLNSLPIFHTFGLVVCSVLPLLLGIKVVVCPSPLQYKIIPEMLYKHGATVFISTDTFLSGYAKFAHPYDLFNLRYIFTGAEKLRDTTRQTYMDKYGIRILEGYGATETSPAISLNTPMHNKKSTVGRLLPGIEAVLLPVEGVKHGGRLAVYGDNIMLGYLKADKPGVVQKPTAVIDNKVRNGWYDTGDIVDIDEEGYLSIIGRAKRFAKIAGEMISLTAVEDWTKSLWPEALVAAVSKKHEAKGEQVILFTDHKHASRDDLVTHFKELKVADIFIPREVRYIKDMPILGSGKLDYASIQAMLDEEG